MDSLAQLQQAEAQLLRAQLAGDADTLARLAADDLLFVGPAGQLITKAMDLAMHRSGLLRLTSLVAQEPQIEWTAGLGVVSVVVELSGFYEEQPIGGQFRYLRVWSTRQGVWQIIAGSCTPLLA